MDKLSKIKKPSRTLRKLEINKLYEKTISQEFKLKACVLPHELGVALDLFCCVPNRLKEKLFEKAIEMPNRLEQQIALVHYHSSCSYEWLNLYHRFSLEADFHKITLPVDNLSLLSNKWAIKHPKPVYSTMFAWYFWEEGECFGNYVIEKD